jgi:membrane protein YqaA with SNARE-associated domain
VLEVPAALVAGVTSGLLPIAFAEASALAAAAVPDLPLRALVLVVFTVGHVAGKAVWYWLGAQEAHVTHPGLRRRLDRARQVVTTHPTASISVMLASATISTPPFHLTAIAAGIVRAPVGMFLTTAFVGRLARFSAIAAVPSLIDRLW